MNILIISENKNYIDYISENIILYKINNIFILGTTSLKQDNIKICDNYKQNQNITILINQNMDYITEINNYTREINGKLIVLFTDGINGTIFIDYGLNYNYLEYDNYNITIQNILNDGSIICLDNHNITHNDIILFSQLEGKNTEILYKEWEIEKIINNKTIKLKNLNEINFDFLNGIIIKKNKFNTINHNVFDLNLLNDKFKNIKLLINNKLIMFFFCDIIIFEIYKILTNKYKPLTQYFEWLEFDKINFNILKEKNLDNLSIKIIGNGLLCNKHLKNLSLLNINNIKLINNNEILEKNDIILSGLNNIDDRKNTALECFKKNIPFFDCGVSKNMGYTFPVIPFITETYNNLNDFEYKTDYLPCIINNFPYNQYHTYDWATEKYNLLVEKYKLKNNNLKDSIEISLKLFDEYFNKNIEKLLDNFKDIDSNFWSKGKKCPHIILFNENNKLHIKFMELTLSLISNYNIKYSSEFNIINVEKQEINNEIIKNKWIKNCSKIRMNNYNIPYNKENKTHNSTLNIVSTLTIIEIIKYIIQDNTQKYYNTFLNLNYNLIIKSLTLDHGFFIINEQKINNWTKFKYEQNTNLKIFKEHYENMFNIKITMMVIDTTIIYNEELGIYNLNRQLNEIIHENCFISLLTDTDIDLPDIEIIL